MYASVSSLEMTNGKVNHRAWAGQIRSKHIVFYTTRVNIFSVTSNIEIIDMY